MLYEIGLLENPQMARDARLRDAQDFGYFAHTHFLMLKQLEDSHTVGICEGFEGPGQYFHGSEAI